MGASAGRRCKNFGRAWKQSWQRGGGGWRGSGPSQERRTCHKEVDRRRVAGKECPKRQRDKTQLSS
jgi:hypothetical protein